MSYNDEVYLSGNYVHKTQGTLTGVEDDVTDVLSDEGLWSEQELAAFDSEDDLISAIGDAFKNIKVYRAEVVDPHEYLTTPTQDLVALWRSVHESKIRLEVLEEKRQREVWEEAKKTYLAGLEKFEC